MDEPVPIASLVQEGIATVEGQVRRTDAALLEASASGRQCVAYVVSSGVLTGALEQAGQAFFLKDESGEILVLPERFTARFGHLEMHADKSESGVRTRKETILAVGDWVRVTGHVEERTHALAGGSGYRDRATLMTISTPADEPLVLVADGAEDV